MCACVRACVCVRVRVRVRVLIDDWRVTLISGVYAASHQLHAAAESDDQPAAADAAGESGAEDNAAEPTDEVEAEKEESRQQTDHEAEKTNGNSEDYQFSKKRSESSKYSVVPRTPTSSLFLVIYGDLGKTGLLPLTAEDTTKDVLLEAGQADEFKVSLRSCRESVI